MAGLIAPGKVTLIRNKDRDTVAVDVFKSMRDMVHAILTKSSERVGEGYFGSSEHLDALNELEDALRKTKIKVKRDLEVEAALERERQK